MLAIVIAITVQVIYILALKDIRVGTNQLLADNDPNGPFKIMHRGVSWLYYLSWVGLVVTLLWVGSFISVTMETQRRINAFSDRTYPEPVVTRSAESIDPGKNSPRDGE